MVLVTLSKLTGNNDWLTLAMRNFVFFVSFCTWWSQLVYYITNHFLLMNVNVVL